MSKTSCKYNWHDTGRQVFYDNSTLETVWAQYPIYFYDDFLGADTAFPAAGADESGCKWVLKDISAAGAPTGGKLADTVNGVVELALAANVEVETIQINGDDQLVFNFEQGLIFEARVAMSVMPAASAARGIFGMGGAWVAGGAAHRVGFEILTGGTINAEEDDAVTDTSADTGITAVAGAYNIFRIDCTTVTDIKYFIDGARVCASTTFNNASSTANSRCQPYFGCQKTANAALATMLVDYVKIWQNRS